MTLTQDREEALEHLQWFKERHGPSYEACMAQVGYVSAAWKVVELNTPLIHWILRPFRQKAYEHYDDLVHELAIVMFRCCYNWEPSLGKFSSYVVVCLRLIYPNKVAELRQLERPGSLPVNLRTEKARAAHKKQIAERAQELVDLRPQMWEQEDMKRWWEKVSRINTAIRAASRLELMAQAQPRYTHTYRDGDGFFSGQVDEVELLVDEDSPNVEDGAFLLGLRDALENGLSGLPKREAAVLRYRFGLDDNEPKTLDQVGNWLGVTRGRARQIEAKGLRQLRHPQKAKFYNVYA